jgi:hypothetical protein
MCETRRFPLIPLESETLRHDRLCRVLMLSVRKALLQPGQMYSSILRWER